MSVKDVVEVSFDQGMEKADQLKEKPLYMMFGLLTVGSYILYGWVGVLGWFVLNIVLDFVLMKKDGEI